MASYLGDIFRKITSSSTSSTPIQGLTVNKDEPGRGIYKGIPVSVICPAPQIQVKRLRTLKHPGIIAYIASDDSNPNSIWLVTESVRPLLDTREVVDNLDWAALLAWQAASTILFLNNHAGIIHCRIQGDYMFLDDYGMFKLGGFEQSINKRDPTEFDRTDKRFREDMDEESFHSIDQPRMLSFIKNELGLKIKADTLEQIVNELETHRLVHLISKLDSLHIDPEPDKLATVRAVSVFVQNATAPKPLVFKMLTRLWDSLSGSELSVDTVRVLCECTSRLVDCTDSRNIFNKRALEIYSNLLKNNERAIRLFLIDNLDKILGKIDDAYLKDAIYPILTTSLQDATPRIRDSALRTLISVSPRLPVNIVSGELLRHIARLQEDPQASIRTNLLIGLGKLEDRIPEDIRSKIIGPAYSHGLRDPFSPAKVAALDGLLRSFRSCGKEEIATKLLPAVCPLLIDGDREVSTRAVKLIGLFMQFFKIPESTPSPPLSSTLVKEEEKITRKMGEVTMMPPEEASMNQPTNTKDILSKLEKSATVGTGKSRLGATRKL